WEADDEPGERIGSIRGLLGGLYCFIEVAEEQPSPEGSKAPKPARRGVQETAFLEETIAESEFLGHLAVCRAGDCRALRERARSLPEPRIVNWRPCRWIHCRRGDGLFASRMGEGRSSADGEELLDAPIR